MQTYQYAFTEKQLECRELGKDFHYSHHFLKLPIVLVNPNCRLETKDVFGAFRGNYSEPIDSYLLEKSWSQEKLEDLLTSKQQNDLYDAAVSLVPQISQVLTLLRELPGVIGVGMSGSGATCFAIFEQSKTSKINEALEGLTRQLGGIN